MRTAFARRETWLLSPRATRAVETFASLSTQFFCSSLPLAAGPWGRAALYTAPSLRLVGLSCQIDRVRSLQFSTTCPQRRTLVSSCERQSMSETMSEPSKPSLRIKGRLMSASEIERTLVRLAHKSWRKATAAKTWRWSASSAAAFRWLSGWASSSPASKSAPSTPACSTSSSIATTSPPPACVPVVTPGAIGFDVEGRDVVLCDDVLYTGRTIRAALDALFDHGRPRRVQLAVLIDRGHRELPIEATYVGKHVPTSSREIIEVKFREVDNDEQVLLVERVD